MILTNQPQLSDSSSEGVLPRFFRQLRRAGSRLFPSRRTEAVTQEPEYTEAFLFQRFVDALLERYAHDFALPASRPFRNRLYQRFGHAFAQEVYDELDQVYERYAPDHEAPARLRQRLEEVASGALAAFRQLADAQAHLAS